MKTKTTIHRTLSIFMLVLFLLPVSLMAKGDFSKPTKKEFKINKGAKLALNCEFTGIKAYNWDKDVISIEVTVTVDAKNQSKADDKFERVIVEMSGNSNLVELSTGLGSGYFNNKNNNSIDIDVLIYYPAHINLELDNEFGSSFFENIDGAVNADIAYGNFEATNLSSDQLDLHAEFGQINVKRFQSGKVKVAYGGFTAQVAAVIKLDSEFSSNEIETVSQLDLETAYDKNYFGEVSVVFAESEFSSIRIDELKKHIELDIDYGSIKIRDIASDFDMINISSEFTGVDLYFKSPANFAFKASSEMGNIKYPQELAKITYLEKEMMELDIEGYFGNAKGQAPKLILSMENATANIKID